MDTDSWRVMAHSGEGGYRRRRSMSTFELKAEVVSTNRVMDAPSTTLVVFLLFLGTCLAFVSYNLLMEAVTSSTQDKPIEEIPLICITSFMYAIAGRVLMHTFKEKRHQPVSVIPMCMTIVVNLLGSYFSFASLRYLSYPNKIMGKCCKPLSVMVFGFLLSGKRYSRDKVLAVALLSAGVGLFIVGGRSQASSTLAYLLSINMGPGSVPSSGAMSSGSSSSVGLVCLALSLSLDGVTGILQDAQAELGGFTLMYYVHAGKAGLGLGALLLTGQLGDLVDAWARAGIPLLRICVAGAFGQMCMYMIIVRCGSLVGTLAGLCQKMCTLVASILLYSHPVDGMQAEGILLSFVGMWMYSIRGKNKRKPETDTDTDTDGDIRRIMTTLPTQQGNLPLASRFVRRSRSLDTDPPTTPTATPSDRPMLTSSLQKPRVQDPLKAIQASFRVHNCFGGGGGNEDSCSGCGNCDISDSFNREGGWGSCDYSSGGGCLGDDGGRWA